MLNKHFWREIGDSLWFFLVCVLLGLGAAFGANWFGEYQCHNYQVLSGKPTHYAAFDTCYVMTPSGFQRWDEYKARATASEAEKRK